MATPATTRTISNVPVYHIPEMYPTSPILSFTPPAPSAGRLAERAGMTLTVKTNFGAPDNIVRSPVKNIQPHRNNLPRRRNPKRLRSFQPFTPNEKEEELKEKVPMDEAQPTHVLVINEKARLLCDTFTLDEISEAVRIGANSADSDHLQELIPGLYLAFSDAEPSTVQSKHPKGKPWTHTVHISYPAEPEPHNGTTEQSYGGGVQRLHIVLPSSTRAQMLSSSRTGLGLTDAQLRTVRDFIAQALPRHLASLPDQSDVRVLVTAPHGRPTDVMCAAGCYLSFASGQEVEAVLRFVDEEPDFLSIWKGEVSEDECERTQKIASSWSWLNQVQKPN